MRPIIVARLNALMTRMHLADSGVGDSHAVDREQELHPPGPRLPDPPAGVVRLWLPALVSSPASTILTQITDLSEGVCVCVCVSVRACVRARVRKSLPHTHSVCCHSLTNHQGATQTRGNTNVSTAWNSSSLMLVDFV